MKSSTPYHEIFTQLGSDWTVSSNLMKSLEIFTCNLYLSKDEKGDTNQLRYKLFCTKKGEKESYQLPPYRDTLQKHAQRACYQAGIWKKSLVIYPIIPSPEGKGWHLENNTLTPDWMDIEPAPNAVLELLACKCNSKPCDSTPCQCARNGLLCTDMCRHPDTCTNKQSDADDNFPNLPNGDDYDDGDEEF